MSKTTFSVTYDYRCPFARNAHEHLVVALRGGAPWDVEFVPFSLSQTHVEEGATAVWDDPAKARDLLATEVGLVVRDTFPDHFFDVHLGLFAARHDRSLDLRDESVIHDVLGSAGVDADEVFATVAQGGPRDAYRKAHEAAVTGHQVFGVPTFVVGDSAAFVRLMTRPGADTSTARSTIEGILALFDEHPELNEFKYTSIDR
ncbi:MAG TPA: DsbA family protein [Acidimicrobiales bacterium]